MAYKFPWTNYHELNLDWIIDTVKKLFAQTEQNNAIVEQYDGRLTEVELTADNAQTAAEQAQSDSATALDLAQNAAQTATQAQQAAGQAQQAAGQAQTAAGQAQEAAATAQQTATQAQQTAQNFDGRIRQAENNAASALQAAQAFDEQVQGAITAANNANEAATAALTTSAETSRELAAQRDTLEDIIENAAQSLEVDLSTKADVIINTASGNIASFNDGADDMNIKSLIVNIEPTQAGSGDPSPDNVRPISGHTGANIERRGLNLYPILIGEDTFINNTNATHINNNGVLEIITDSSFNSGVYTSFTPPAALRTAIATFPAGVYIVSFDAMASVAGNCYIGYENTGAKMFNLTTSYQRYSFSSTFSNIARSFVIYSQSNARTIYVKNLQIEYGEVLHDYESYTGNQIYVNWETEAGTVYGGTLDVISGVLKVDRVYIAVTSLARNSATSYYFIPPVSLIGDQYDVLSDKVKTAIISTDVGVFINWNGAVRLNTEQEFDTAADCLAYFGGQFNIVAKLRNPIEYQLTPQDVKTLYQYNNIWSDVGSVNVEYPADTKTYIDNKFAELQALILEH